MIYFLTLQAKLIDPKRGYITWLEWLLISHGIFFLNKFILSHPSQGMKLSYKAEYFIMISLLQIYE